ncbi:MAG: dienelactone hydrolase family protein [Bacteroidia bacterium]|nr:dienelactone hydrolase family protein [Bacteroidia bacterium]
MKTSALVLFIALAHFIFKAEAQTKITFPSTDKLTITADLYESDKKAPYIILFHQAGYSRGEYKETASKITKLGYNCLAVDLRSGEEVNYIRNETALEAKKKNLQTGYLDAKNDMTAAIDYAYNKSNKPVIVFGSSYSASLSLVLAKGNSKVKAVVAFSPGEYFDTALNVQETLKGFDKPVFAASSKKEYPYLEELMTNVTKDKTLFQPQSGDGEHGSKALWKSNKSNNEYWMSLMVFLKKYLN